MIRIDDRFLIGAVWETDEFAFTQRWRVAEAVKWRDGGGGLNTRRLDLRIEPYEHDCAARVRRLCTYCARPWRQRWITETTLASYWRHVGHDEEGAP